jgi:hypothetical protein
MSYKLSYENGIPIAYLKKDGEYKIVYLQDIKNSTPKKEKEENSDCEHSEEDEEKEKIINHDKSCLKCQQGGCLKCEGSCKDKTKKCCRLCK